MKHLISFLAITIIISLVAISYYQQKQTWQNQINTYKKQYDSLSLALHEIQEDCEKERRTMSAQITDIRKNKFDAFNTQDFRIYGLYRDEEKQYTISQIADMFNINNISAIKHSDVLGERWFIVPVKGVHFVGTNQNATSIAKLYYKTIADSTLIIAFNKKIVVGKHIFIPFE